MLIFEKLVLLLDFWHVVCVSIYMYMHFSHNILIRHYACMPTLIHLVNTFVYLSTLIFKI